jgi:uracil phosphoribosyltransferase
MHEHPDFPNLFVVDHPLVQHKLSLMRDRQRSTNGFRLLLREIALLMGYEITRDLPTELVRIETPVAAADVPKLAGKKLAVVPILRAGLEMADGLIELVPSARIGHIGLFRDPATKRPTEYFVKLPEAGGRIFVVVDPMLATGHSLAHATEILKQHGVDPGSIRVMALVAAPEGVRAFHAVHPEVPVYVASLDSHLNDHAYIVPGLGDAGDRLFGTKERE